MSPKRSAPAASDAPLEDDSPDFITSVARAFAVLRCFRSRERFLGVREIARRTGLPKSTIARLSYTLTRLGYLEYLPAEEKYSLGIGVLGLAQHYLAGLDVRQVARPLMQELAESTHATVALGARDGDHMVFIELCHGNQLFRLSVEVGQRVPRGTTALGRAGFVALSERDRAKMVASYLKRVDKPEWPKVQAALDEASREYEKYGFCFSLGDWNKEVFAVGVPLMLSEDQLLAISCFGPMQEMTRERLIGEIGPRVVQLRDRVRAKLRGPF
jgi:DNA-binding IclR family transcriptional regulator